MKLLSKIMFIILPVLVGIIALKPTHQLDTYSVFVEKLAQLPDLKGQLLNDLANISNEFSKIPTSFIFQTYPFPNFDASSMGAFFSSIGGFFSAFGSNLFNIFTSLFNGLSSFFNAIGMVFKMLGNTYVNAIEYMLKMFWLVFGW